MKRYRIVMECDADFDPEDFQDLTDAVGTTVLGVDLVLIAARSNGEVTVEEVTP